MISIKKNNPRADLITYHFKEPHELKPISYAPFPRQLVKDGLLAQLSPSACAVLPVLHCLADENGVVRHSIGKIAQITGLEYHAASRGIINELSRLPEAYKIKSYPRITENGHYTYWHHVPPVGVEEGDSFPFRRCIIESGTWARVSRAGKQVYLACRTFYDYSCTAFELDGMIPISQDSGLDTKEKKRAFAMRPFDVCTADRETIKILLGIRKQETLQKAFNDLERFGLMENTEFIEGLRVYLTPRFLYSKSI